MSENAVHRVGFQAYVMFEMLKMRCSGLAAKTSMIIVLAKSRRESG